MPSPSGDQSLAFAVITWLTVTGDSQKLEQEFVRAAEFLRRQPDFDFIVLVRLLRRSDVIVQLGYWRTHAAFVNAVRQPRFAAQIEKLSPKVIEAQADQAVSVVRIIAPPTCKDPRDACGILTEYIVAGDEQTFEEASREHAQAHLAQGGFGGFDLLRSTLRPRRYLGMSWWYDDDACEAAIRADADLLQRNSVIQAEAVRLERTQRIFYEKAIEAG